MTKLLSELFVNSVKKDKSAICSKQHSNVSGLRLRNSSQLYLDNNCEGDGRGYSMEAAIRTPPKEYLFYARQFRTSVGNFDEV